MSDSRVKSLPGDNCPGDNCRNKVFVGNVPFQCTNEEFANKFKHMDGYVSCDVKLRHKSEITRGFGFVVFENEKYAQELIKRTDIIMGGRSLRFNFYSPTIDKQPRLYRARITNLKPDVTEEQLCTELNKYGEVIKCAIIQRTRPMAVVAFSSPDAITRAQESLTLGMIELSQPKKIQRFNNHHRNPQNAYREGFRGGYSLGFKQGYNKGYDLAMAQRK